MARRTASAFAAPAFRRTAVRMGGLLVATALFLPGCASQRPVDQVKASGDDAYDRGDFILAREEFGEAVDRYPGDWQAQYRYGMSCLELGAWDSARTALKVAHDRRPADGDIADAYARALFHTGDREALVAFLWSRATDAGETRDWTRAATWLDRIGDRDAALAAIETAIEVDQGVSAMPYMVAAELAERNGDEATAIRRLRQAYGIAPGDAEVTAALEALGEIPGPSFALPPGR
ncbi:MAG: tetratricopeptide repeat protein [Planctomycetota bacterium]